MPRRLQSIQTPVMWGLSVCHVYIRERQGAHTANMSMRLIKVRLLVFLLLSKNFSSGLVYPIQRLSFSMAQKYIKTTVLGVFTMRHFPITLQRNFSPGQCLEKEI
jgi:hypothetical protein